MKILKIIAIVLLAILPYSTVLSNFSPYWNTSATFGNYLVASLLFAIASLLLGRVVSSGKFFASDGFFFFILGLLTAPPFMIGPPEESPKLLERIAEEHFRYGLLLLSVLAFIIAFTIILRKYWKNLSLVNKLILVPAVSCFVLLIWDNATSYNFSTELMDWKAEGRDISTFFPNYNYHTFWRTLGRSLIYILIPWLSLILFREARIKKAQMVFLMLFSLVGVVFFLLTNFIGMQFYFPLMVPAVALAPAYWLGLMLLSERKVPV